MRRPNFSRKSRVAKFPAPVRGWITNEPLDGDIRGGAAILENFFPTQTGVRLRKGSRRVATLPAAVGSMWGYTTATAAELFAATSGTIYDATSPANVNEPGDAVVAGQTGGEYSAQQIGTVGGEYLYAVNGADHACLYDGTNWHKVQSLSTVHFRADHAAGVDIAAGLYSGKPGNISVFAAGRISDTRSIVYVQTFTPTAAITGEAFTAGGVTFTPIEEEIASPTTITGVDSSTFSQVFLHKNRLFFVEGDSLSAWFLPVDSIGGAAAELSLAAVFQRGGKLLFGASWSADAGDGLDDRAVFVSDQGEAAIYQGDDPSDAASWSLVGRYVMTPPLGKNAYVEIAGDVLIATREGLVPISGVAAKDPAALSLSAASRPIEVAWAQEVAARQTLPWSVLKWDEGNMFLVGLPTEAPGGSVGAKAWAANAETGGWAVFTGWDVRALATAGRKAYFGASTGGVFEVEATGADDGAAYIARMALHPSDCGSPGQFKIATLGRAVTRMETTAEVQVSASANFAPQFPAARQAVAATPATEWNGTTWGAGIWGGVRTPKMTLDWQALNRSGISLMLQAQITHGDDTAPVVEILSLEAMLQDGGHVA